jgi:hypothetical protein
MSRRRKSAHIERIRSSLARAVGLPRPPPTLPHQYPYPGRERAWKRFVEEDIAFRMPGDLARRLEAYALRLNAEQPELNASATEIAYFLLTWALDQQQLMDTEMDIIGAALAAEGNRANQALELLRERLQELETFDSQRLMTEVAELERLQQDLNELCTRFEQLTDAP